MLRQNLLYTVLLCCVVRALAQSDALTDSIIEAWDKEIDLSEVVVTGTRTPKTLKDVPVLTRVISVDDIRKSDATNIQDMLQTELPGVEFSYAMNQQVNMNLSGFAGQGVLILVDGERLAGETMDNVDFNRLSMADVERIEIVRGTASALYGSSAAGGVINIIRKKPTETWTLHVDSRWAQHNEQRYNGALGVRRGKMGNSIACNYISSDNYKVENRGKEPQTSTFAQVYGGTTLSVSDKLTLTLNDDMHIDGKAGYYYRTMDRVADSQERYRDYQGGLRMEWKMTERDNIEASYNYDQYDKSEYLRTRGIDIRKYSNVQNSSRMLYNRNVREGDMLTAGVDYMYDYLMNTNLDGDSHSQQTFDIFCQYDCKIDSRWELLGALRYDYFSDGKLSRITPKISARWNPVRRLTLRTSYGMGFRAPTLKERYYNFDMAGIWIVEGNGELNPEKSHNVTLGAEYRHGGYSFSISGNYNRVGNRITTGMPYHKDQTSQWYLQYLNLSDMNVYSAEATCNANFGRGFSAKASYMFTHEQMSETTANQYMPARKHSLTVRCEWDRQMTQNYGINISLSGRALGSVKSEEYRNILSPEEGTHSVEYPAYSIWKMMVVCRIGSWAKASVTIDNIFDYKPEYYYYNSPLTQGINIMGGISLEIDKIFR